MDYCELMAFNMAEAQEISKQVEVEVALLINIEQALRIALDWKTDQRGNNRKLSTLRFVMRSFERHLARVRALSEYGGYMHVVTDMKPHLTKEIQKLKQLRDELQVHLDQMMLRMEHISPNENSAFEGLCVELEDYLKVLDSHARLEVEVLQQCLTQEEGGSG